MKTRFRNIMQPLAMGKLGYINDLQLEKDRILIRSGNPVLIYCFGVDKLGSLLV